jgi:hypothetical protein
MVPSPEGPELRPRGFPLPALIELYCIPGTTRSRPCRGRSRRPLPSG